MFEMIIAVLGIAASALYVGFLALKIHSVPLWVIVIATFVLVIREFFVEFMGAANQAKRDARKA
ncbi:MAG: hypothetical protein WAU52_10570 [Burkholderiales bacterium]